MIEVLVAALIGVAVGAHHGWPAESSAVAGGLLLGPILYVISTAVWTVAPCWWPGHKQSNKLRPSPWWWRRRTRPCRLCGNKDRIRWGSRKIWGRS